VTVSLQATFRGHRVTLKMMVLRAKGRMAKARGTGKGDQRRVERRKEESQKE